MGTDVARLSEEERRELDTILEETPEGLLLEQQPELQEQPGLLNQTVQLLQPGLNTVQEGLSTVQEGLSTVQSIAQEGLDTLQNAAQPLVNAAQPLVNAAQPFVNQVQSFMPGQQGGLQLPSNQMSIPETIMPSAFPGGGATLAIDTSPEAFMRDGLDQGMMGRQIRRNPYRAQSMPMMQSYTPGPPQQGNMASSQVVVKKLE
jgi:hypothetical protein